MSGGSFNRPHAEELRARVHGTAAGATGATRAPPAPVAAPAADAADTGQRAVPRPEDAAERAALLNRATGGNVPHLSRVHADVGQKRRVNTAALPQHAAEVKAGQLYFIRTEQTVNEGQLCVGLARAMESTSDKDGSVKVKWFARNEWLKGAQARWSKTPSFQGARDPDTGRVGFFTLEKLSDFIPLEPELTPAAKKPANKDKPRLTADGVRALTEFCKQRGLVREIGEEQEGEEDGYTCQ